MYLLLQAGRVRSPGAERFGDALAHGPELPWGQTHGQGGEVVVEVAAAAGSRERDDALGAGQEPGEVTLRRRAADLGGAAAQALDRGEVGSEVGALEALLGVPDGIQAAMSRRRRPATPKAPGSPRRPGPPRIDIFRRPAPGRCPRP